MSLPEEAHNSVQAKTLAIIGIVLSVILCFMFYEPAWFMRWRREFGFKDRVMARYEKMRSKNVPAHNEEPQSLDNAGVDADSEQDEKTNLLRAPTPELQSSASQSSAASSRPNSANSSGANSSRSEPLVMNVNSSRSCRSSQSEPAKKAKKDLSNIPNICYRKKDDKGKVKIFCN